MTFRTFHPGAVLGPVLGSLVTTLAAGQPTSFPPPVALLKAFRPLGASGNNLQHPPFDPIPGTPERALAPLLFSGPANALVAGPNPRTISNVISGGTGADGQDGQTTDPTASAWLYVFGQFVDHDLDLEATPADATPINIAVPAGDPVFTDGTVIAMTRDSRSPATNTILNTTAGYLDLSQLYGSDPGTVASLRNADGTLRSSDGGRALPVAGGVFVTGDPRVMENPELTAVTTLFMREHNVWVGLLATQHPSWSGEQLYQMARELTTAEYQNIIYTEYLPALIGSAVGSYRGYASGVRAQVTQEFSTAAFRVGHSQVSDTQEGLDNSGNVVFSQALADAFFNTPAMDEAHGFDPLLRAIGADYSQATDVYAVAALRNLLFAGLVGGDVDAMDLIAIDIQRERDVGLASLNQTRQALGLKPYQGFAQVTSDPVLRAHLETVFGTIDQLDLFMGGMAEDHARGAEVGPTFQAIIASQFEALRAGDRFFWQNEGFNPEAARMIQDTRLSDLILRNTDTLRQQPDVFLQADLPLPHQPTHVHWQTWHGLGHRPPRWLP